MAYKIVVAAAAFLSSALADVPGIYQDPYPAVAPVYNYQYGVNDPKYGAVFSQSENRQNYDTAGEYRVNLPDGRVQIVTYSAGPDGYVADVKYEGEASYPETEAYHPAPAAYKPAPVQSYKPAPVQSYKPAPVQSYKPAPVQSYKPAPVVYKPAPVQYKPAPAVYKPVAAPIYRQPSYPAQPTAPKKYGFSIVASPEAKEAELPQKSEAVVEENKPVVVEVEADPSASNES